MARIGDIHGADGGSMFTDEAPRMLDKRNMDDQGWYDAASWPFSPVFSEHAGRPGMVARIESVSGGVITRELIEQQTVTDDCGEGSWDMQE